MELTRAFTELISISWLFSSVFWSLKWKIGVQKEVRNRFCLKTVQNRVLLWLVQFSIILNNAISQKFSTLICQRHTFCRLLEKTQYFNYYVWKFLKKRNKIQERSIACSYIWHVNTQKYVYYTHILWNFGEVMCCQTQMLFISVILFSDIGTKKQSWK